MNDTPSYLIVLDPQFVASPTDRRYRSRLRQAKPFSQLKFTHQEARLKSSNLREGRSCYLAFKPDERLILLRHHMDDMSYPTYSQEQISGHRFLTRRCSGRRAGGGRVRIEVKTWRRRRAPEALGRHKGKWELEDR